MINSSERRGILAGTIILWDSDPIFRNALSRALSWKGFRTVALQNPSQLSSALKLENPELAILEGDWKPGSRISLDREMNAFMPYGNLSVILPSIEETPAVKPEFHGIVLENLRKPFGTADLLAGVRSAFVKKERIENKPLPWKQYLEVRRLKTEQEILSALELRYQVYRETGYVDTSDKKLEIDQYDPQSIFLGAVFRQNGTKELVGMVRIIRSGCDGPHCHELRNIIQDRDIENQAASNIEKLTLPALISFGITHEDLARLSPGFGASLSGCGIEVSSEICELSRLVIRQKYRRHRFGIERKLYELIIMDCSVVQPAINWFVIAVHPSRCVKFERFGFKRISALGTKFYTGISQPAVLMTLDLSQYLCSPNPFTSDMELNTLVYKFNGNLLSSLPERPNYLKMAGAAL